jgi:hypothetical protein
MHYWCCVMTEGRHAAQAVTGTTQTRPRDSRNGRKGGGRYDEEAIWMLKMLAAMTGDKDEDRDNGSGWGTKTSETTKMGTVVAMGSGGAAERMNNDGQGDSDDRDEGGKDGNGIAERAPRQSLNLFKTLKHNCLDLMTIGPCKRVAMIDQVKPRLQRWENAKRRRFER